MHQQYPSAHAEELPNGLEPRIAEPCEIGHRAEECSCRLWDDGDPENGPHLAVELHGRCPLHGQGTKWAAEHGITYDDDEMEEER